LSAVFTFYPGRIAEAQIPFMQSTFLAVLLFVVAMTPNFAQVVEDISLKRKDFEAFVRCTR